MSASAVGGMIRHSMQDCSPRTWRGEGRLSLKSSEIDIPQAPRRGGFSLLVLKTCSPHVQARSRVALRG